MIDENIVYNYLLQRIREEVSILKNMVAGQTKLEPAECCQRIKISELKRVRKELGLGEY